MSKFDICFVGLENLPVLAREYNHLGSGGEQVQQTLLSRALVERGFGVSMVVLDHGQRDGASWDGIKTFKAYAPRAGMRGLRFVHPRWTGMWNALKRADANTYYVSCAGMRVGLVALFCRVHGRRLVFRTASDSDCRPGDLLVAYARDRKLYEYGLRRADAVLTQSAGQRNDMLSNYGVVSEIAGMLVEKPRAIIPAENRNIDILWVNNFQSLKRPDRLLEVARRLPHRNFTMIGGPAPGWTDFFNSTKRDAEVLPNLSFLGRVPYHEVNDFYARAKLLVNTSDIEGFPNSYLQSWIRGTPVVTFIDPDSVIAGEGLGVVPLDLDKMIESLDALLDRGDEWCEMSRRAQVYMAREFADEAVLEPYFRAFGLAR